MPGTTGPAAAVAVAMSNYQPSATPWVQAQIEKIEATGDTRSVDIQGRPVVVLTMTGQRSGNTIKVPLMRVEHAGDYAAVASKGGAPANPQWYANLVANPAIDLHDGTEHSQRVARLIDGDERAQWWERAVAAFPPYAEYATKTDREIPVFVLERA